MIYLVFFLLLTAALLFFFLSDFGKRTSPVADSDPLIAIQTRQKTLKNALSDLEYEFSVGRIERKDFERLQDETLLEWQSLDNELKALVKPEDTKQKLPIIAECPQCGEKLVIAAKFCHACGAKLSQMLIVFFLASLFFLPQHLSALDIRVTVKNATRAQTHKAPLEVQVLKLEKGMELVTQKKTVSGVVEFKDLADNTQGPYMLQTTYEKVIYSKVIPPMQKGLVDAELEIFDATSSTAKIKVRTLAELDRVEEKKIMGILILYFLNSDNRTFTGTTSGGLVFTLPKTATIEQASVSVGGGASNIQWLRVNPAKTNQAGIYTLNQSIKPGERMLQVTFSMPYDATKTEAAFSQPYPQDSGLQLIVEPADVEVSQKGIVQARRQDANLGRGIISFPVTESTVNLVLKGGGIAPMPAAHQEGGELVIRSPLDLWQKIIFPIVALFFFVLVYKLREWKRV